MEQFSFAMEAWKLEEITAALTLQSTEARKAGDTALAEKLELIADEISEAMN